MPIDKSDRKTGRTVITAFVVALILIIIALFVTMSGIIPGDDGEPPPAESTVGPLD